MIILQPEIIDLQPYSKEEVENLPILFQDLNLNEDKEYNLQLYDERIRFYLNEGI